MKKVDDRRNGTELEHSQNRTIKVTSQHQLLTKLEGCQMDTLSH